jgi:tRNA 2-(methylsulfanyl)-N6-isopentenyladenosine37 hydroxylase
LGEFYAGLERSEARHFELYVSLARAEAPDQWQKRLAALAEREAQLATDADPVFRFHSGSPG